MKTFVFSLFIFGFLYFLTFSIFAQSASNELGQYNNYVYDQQVTQKSKATNSTLDFIADGPIRKLGRGLCNTIFGVSEIPIRMYHSNLEQGGLAAWTYGLFKGITYFLGREIIGVTEIITFPIPLPGCSTEKYSPGWGYGPIIEPEWIFDYETNPYNFVYPNYPVK